MMRVTKFLNVNNFRVQVVLSGFIEYLVPLFLFVVAAIFVYELSGSTLILSSLAGIYWNDNNAFISTWSVVFVKFPVLMIIIR